MGDTRKWISRTAYGLFKDEGRDKGILWRETTVHVEIRQLIDKEISHHSAVVDGRAAEERDR